MLLTFALVSPIFTRKELIFAEGEEPASDPYLFPTIAFYQETFDLWDTNDFIQLNSSVFKYRFYKGDYGYNVIYDNDGNELVYNEQMKLEYQHNPNLWKPIGTPTHLGFLKVSDSHYEITRHYTDYLGTDYQITYVLKIGEPVKIRVFFECSQTNVYRVFWDINGITKTNVNNKTDEIVFGNMNHVKERIGFNWFDVNNSFGDITDYIIESDAQGRKMSIYFNRCEQ